jgi:hypothetical protein
MFVSLHSLCLWKSISISLKILSFGVLVAIAYVSLIIILIEFYEIVFTKFIRGDFTIFKRFFSSSKN